MSRSVFAFVLAVFALTSSARADALATSICVLDTATYQKLVKEFGDVQKIPTADLWKASLHRGFFKVAKESYDTTFKSGDRTLRLIASRKGDTNTILCTLLETPENKPATVLSAGPITEGPRKIADDDPFVIVLHSGNFLLH